MALGALLAYLLAFVLDHPGVDFDGRWLASLCASTGVLVRRCFIFSAALSKLSAFWSSIAKIKLLNGLEGSPSAAGQELF